MMCECGCGKETNIGRYKKPNRFIKGHNPKGCGMGGKHHSKKSRKQMSDKRKGRPSTFKGKHHTEKTKEHWSNLRKGKPSPNKGMSMSKEQKKKISDKKKGTYTGINSPHWKGGKALRNARRNSKRRAFGNSFINEIFEGSEGHHIDKDNILYIPKELHRSISHNVTTGKNMDLINLESMKWIMGLLDKYKGESL